MALVLLALAACEVEWGGAEVGLETPAPPRPADTAREAGARPELPPLPTGPLLHAVRVDTGGRAVAVAAARMTDRGPATLELPPDAPDRWWEAFDDRFQAPGTELPLYATGRRIGTLVLTGIREPDRPGCPAPVEGRVLLPPGAPAPGLAFAWRPAGEGAPPAPEPPLRPASTSRLRTFGPILAERLLEEAGIERSFLARRAELKPVAFAGDTVPGMAATYLIGDTLAATPPPGGASASLFYLARYVPAEGYVPVWSRVASYRDTADKLALAHLDWLPAGGGRVEMLRRIDARGVRLAAVVTGGEERPEELSWTAPDRCPVLSTLEAPAGRGGAAAAGGPGRAVGGGGGSP